MVAHTTTLQNLSSDSCDGCTVFRCANTILREIFSVKNFRIVWAVRKLNDTNIMHIINANAVQGRCLKYS